MAALGGGDRPGRIAGQAGHVVAGRLQARRELGADGAGDAGDEDPHAECPLGDGEVSPLPTRDHADSPKKCGGCGEICDETEAFAGLSRNVCVLRERPWRRSGPVWFDADLLMARLKKISCEDCYFRRNLLCALSLEEPCTTFRPDHPEGLRPPPQMRMVFERSTRAAWAFPSAQEQAALYAGRSGPDEAVAAHGALDRQALANPVLEAADHLAHRAAGIEQAGRRLRGAVARG